MRNLLQDTDRDRLVAPLAGPLAGEVIVGGARHRALAEAEGSPLFPAEAAAFGAELLLLPGLRETHAPLGDGLLDFVMAMAEAPLPCRRAASGGIEIRRDDPRDVDVLTPFFRLSGNLLRGELRQEPRGFGRLALRHTGNLVEFRNGRARACVDVEDAVTEAAVTREGDLVVLRHVSAIRGPSGWFRPREIAAGTLEMRYEARADSPVLRVVARFTAAQRVARLRLSTALDALDEEGLDAGAARLSDGAAWRDALPPGAPGVQKWTDGVAVAHLVVGRAGWPAAAPVLHLRPLDPGRVMSVTAQAQRPGALHWLLLRHGPVTLRAGESLEITEERMLAAGGDHAATAAAMAAGATGLDLVPAPYAGAALHAVATALFFDARGGWATPLPPERRAALAAFAARHLARIEAGAPGRADLALAAIAADTLRRAGDTAMGGPQARLVARLVAPADAADRPGLAGHSLAILALARAAAGADAAPVLPALAAALAAVTPEPGGGLRFAGEAIRLVEDAEALALLARAAGAAVLAAEAGAALPQPAVERARDLHRAAVALLRPLVRPRVGILEVVGAAGMTAALQAMTTLALLAPDRLLLAGNATAATPA